ncbi:cytochrome c [Geotalea toluenoxydans]
MAVKNWFFVFLLISLPAVYVQQAVAQKESHRDYASMKVVECNDCHKNEGVALNHDADWLRGHRLPAQKGVSNCGQCHDQSYCLDCHTGGGINADLSTQNYRRDYIPKSHKSDWIEIHPIKAQDNPQSCTRCHDQKNCQDCHSRYRSTDLQFQSHRRQFRDIKVSDIGPNHAIFTTAQCPTCHQGGILPSHQWSSDHASEARRNLQSCGTCHSDGDVCMTCHSARTGLKINPHPRNWNGIKGNYRDKSSGRTCVRCHDRF